MKYLVIHPYDLTTGFLEPIYSDLEATVISERVSNKRLKEEIKNHTHIIMLGHGDNFGLFYDTNYYIDSSLVYLLREKYCIGIWCFASSFFEQYKLKGFATGMFISELDEAYLYSVDDTIENIWKSNELFARVMRDSLVDGEELSLVLENYKGDSNVIEYNRSLMKQF